MEDLTFGEQVKIILGRKGMTIKELAETIEKRTGQKMSRQNLTQRLGRDNFQEQDMRKIAEILGCPFLLSILSGDIPEVKEDESAETEKSVDIVKSIESVNSAEPANFVKELEGQTLEERDMTIGELYKIHEGLSQLEENIQEGKPIENIKEELQKTEASVIGTQKKPGEEKKGLFRTGAIFLRKKGDSAEEVKDSAAELGLAGEPKPADEPAAGTENVAEPEISDAQGLDISEGEVPVSEPDDFEPVIRHDDAEEDRELGDVNPYTGREYQSNSVRMHPTRIGYVQVYDRATHKWTDMTEWAFLGYQERKKALLGKEYEPPIYLD